MKLRKKDILKIEAGVQEPFAYETPRQPSVARAMCSQINFEHPEHPVRYRVRTVKEKGLFLIIGEKKEGVV